ncbi:hypothetical protein QBC35DRAFT_381959 [Podospora australis]|uniref:Riboflavin kinase n=1 Tax=Podospora australis TaxID=1536484 RepID=A0AAN6WVB9_9PEZI|nr:hypothetical protein QBC35DRAFT_381959 [Podospora australis]
MDHPSCLQVGRGPPPTPPSGPPPPYSAFPTEPTSWEPEPPQPRPEAPPLPAKVSLYDNNVGVSLPPPPPPPPRPPRPPPLPLRVNVYDGNTGGDATLSLRPVTRGEDGSGSSGLSPQFGPPPTPRLRTQNSMPDLSRYGPRSPGPSPLSPGPPPGVGPAATFGPGITPGPSKTSQFLQGALSEARHFAGGLIPHPTESTKHYTILRHSSPLLFYRGPKTSVEISIFSAPDYPIPADRTIWMQQRGFSGDSGMKVKALFGSTDDWLNVTPAILAGPAELNQNTDRAWRRDIDKAARKLLKEKGPKKAHIPRETHVIRIPEASDDGYFRLHLCTGGEGIPVVVGGELSSNPNTKTKRRKILCTSPVFRVASTSTDSSVFRGASLTTLPLEAAAFVGSRAILARAAPVIAPIEAGLDRVRPGLIASAAGSFAYETAHEKAQSSRGGLPALSPISRFVSAQDDPGILPPFPFQLQGKVTRGTGRSTSELGIPTANLQTPITPDSLRFSLNKGVYIGWTTFVPQTKSEWQPPVFHKSLISICPSPYGIRIKVAPEPQVTVHLLHEFPSSFVGAELKVLIMGFLRESAHPSTPLEQRLVSVSQDVHMALSCLDRPNWSPDHGAVMLKQKKSERSMGERFFDAKEKVAGKVPLPSVQLHNMGIRVGDGEERDRLHGQGGYWIRR